MSNEKNISKELYNKIDKFIKKLSYNLSEDKDVIRDFEDEMSINLEVSILELLNKGYSEDEAFDIAIKRFGDVKEVKGEMKGIFNINGKLAKKFLIVSIASIIISVVCLLSYKIVNKQLWPRFPEAFYNSVLEKVEADEKISEDKVNDFLAKNKNNFRYVAIVSQEKGCTSIEKIYPSNFSKDEVLKDNDYTSNSIKGTSSGNLQIRYGFVYHDYLIIIVKILKISAIAFFIIYWITFGVWSTLYTKNSKRLSIFWILLFFTLNIVAYILFNFDSKLKLKLQES